MGIGAHDFQCHLATETLLNSQINGSHSTFPQLAENGVTGNGGGIFDDWRVFFLSVQSEYRLLTP